MVTGWRGQPSRTAVWIRQCLPLPYHFPGRRDRCPRVAI